MEKYKMVLLAVACLFMAGLNLWNEFKDWFNKNYQKRTDNRQAGKVQFNEKGKGKDMPPSVIGKSKTVLTFSATNQNQEKEQQKEKEEEKPFHSIDLEIDLEKETIPLDIVPDKGYEYSQAVSVDEFNLLANTLQGKPILEENQPQIKETLQKVQGTDLFEQLVSQVKGAKDITSRILDDMDNKTPNNSFVEFDFNKYIRK